MKRVRHILLTLFLSLAVMISMAQENEHEPIKKGTFGLSIDLTSLSINPRIEIFHKDNRSFSLRASYIPGFIKAYEVTPYFVYNGIESRLSLNFYHTSSKKSYFFHGPQLFYKYQWQDAVRFNPISAFEVERDQNMTRQTIGAQYICGLRSVWGKFTLDFHFGLGPSYRWEDIHVYRSGEIFPSEEWNDEDYHILNDYPWVKFSGGIRIGFVI